MISSDLMHESSPRTFKKLILTRFNLHLITLLKHHATTTGSLTIDQASLSEPEVFDFLTQIDCGEIIIKSHNLSTKELKTFTQSSKRGKVFIKCDKIENKELDSEQWVYEFMKPKEFTKFKYISIKQENMDAQNVIDQLFASHCQKFRGLSISEKSGSFNQNLNHNEILINQDNYIEKLFLITGRLDQIAIIFINNCKNLTKLEINFAGIGVMKQGYQLQETQLQELSIHNCEAGELINEIIAKSVKTLSSLSASRCPLDLSSLQSSQVLRKLSFDHCKINNPEIVATFENLEEYDTQDTSFIYGLHDNRKLKVLKLDGLYDKLKLPDSLCTLQLEGYSLIKLNELLIRNPQIEQINIYVPSQRFEIALLIESHRHIKFNFRRRKAWLRWLDQKQFFEFDQAYYFLHPQRLQPISDAEEPDQIVYEMLAQSELDSKILFGPYLNSIMDQFLRGSDGRSEATEKIQVFQQYQNQIRRQMLSYSEFEKCLFKIIGKEKFAEVKSAFFEGVCYYQLRNTSDVDALRIILSAYNEAFKLGSNVEKIVQKLNGMSVFERLSMQKQISWRNYIGLPSA
ncbi:hypothetical protein FGO68_gene1482 [Halteria grandinella]|uniref:Uncharacterized protein n=1 Tax=Halteria grandinella TaxID=5974 RepID=A0A8J8NYP2_HALGN|nr:hypothetical protein FGO68_gene1482 [Halteria grandinella]